jgi:thiamine-monophosphate kinase
VRFGTTLAGGDLARSATATVDIVVCGAVPKGRALRRDGARSGDGIVVTGPLGGAELGLESKRGAAWKRHLRPEPRIAEGIALRGVATAAMDLSDGLSMDLPRLCEASAVGAEIDSVPPFRGATVEQALHGGDDYELLFTSRRAIEGVIPIGTIVKRPGVRFHGQPMKPAGWDHFRR